MRGINFFLDSHIYNYLPTFKYSRNKKYRKEIKSFVAWNKHVPLETMRLWGLERRFVLIQFDRCYDMPCSSVLVIESFNIPPCLQSKVLHLPIYCGPTVNNVTMLQRFRSKHNSVTNFYSHYAAFSHTLFTLFILCYVFPSCVSQKLQHINLIHFVHLYYHSLS